MNNQQQQEQDSNYSDHQPPQPVKSQPKNDDFLQLPFQSPNFTPFPIPSFPGLSNFALNPSKPQVDLFDEMGGDDYKNDQRRQGIYTDNDDHFKQQQQQQFMYPYYPQQLRFPILPLMKPMQPSQYKQSPFYTPIYPQFMVDNSHYQIQQNYPNINTVSKELQAKVFLIVSQTSISQFQCNCKKSKCLKLYCECFANGQVCSQSCNCLECKNRIDNPQERQKAIEEALIRNNDAFHNILNNKSVAEKEGIKIAQIAQVLVTQAKPQEKKGCNCKKSNCKKKYCECFSENQQCNSLCKCENCLNQVQSISMEAKKEDPQLYEEKKDEYDQEKMSHIDIDIQRISSRSKKIKKKNEENEHSNSQMKIKLKIQRSIIE